MKTPLNFKKPKSYGPQFCCHNTIILKIKRDVSIENSQKPFQFSLVQFSCSVMSDSLRKPFKTLQLQSKAN